MKSPLFKIVGVDNFNRETVSDYVVAENIPSTEFAQVMASALNQRFSGDHAPRFYKVYDQDSPIYKFEP